MDQEVKDRGDTKQLDMGGSEQVRNLVNRVSTADKNVARRNEYYLED